MQGLKDLLPGIKFRTHSVLPDETRGLMPVTFGDIFFVDSGSGDDTANSGRSLKKPLATIDAAIGKCTANNGDIIYVLPGHDENPTTSITMDVAGVSIIGMGMGEARPTVTFGAAGAAVDMSAKSGFIQNIRFDLGSVAATVTNAFNITADSCHVDRCETVPHATSQFTNFLTATDSQFVKITNNLFRGLHTASGTSGIVVDGCDDLIIQGNVVSGHFSEHALDNTTPASCDEILRAFIDSNFFKNDSTTAGDLAVELDGSATGIFSNNMLSGGLATTAANYDIGNLSSLESYIVDDAGVDVHGIVLGTAAV